MATADPTRTSQREVKPHWKALYNTIDKFSSDLNKILKNPVIEGNEETVQYAIEVKKLYANFENDSRVLENKLNSHADTHERHTQSSKK